MKSRREELELNLENQSPRSIFVHEYNKMWKDYNAIQSLSSVAVLLDSEHFLNSFNEKYPIIEDTFLELLYVSRGDEKGLYCSSELQKLQEEAFDNADDVEEFLLDFREYLETKIVEKAREYHVVMDRVYTEALDSDDISFIEGMHFFYDWVIDVKQTKELVEKSGFSGRPLEMVLERHFKDVLGIADSKSFINEPSISNYR